MAKRIVWSLNSLKELNYILGYWDLKNCNNFYSKKLENKFYKMVELIAVFPKIGHFYKNSSFRYVVLKEYKIFYQETLEKIEILYIRDTRRNPEDLDIKV